MFLSATNTDGHRQRTSDLIVPAPKPAVEAILLTVIPQLNQAPQVHEMVQMFLHLQPAPQDTFHRLPFRRKERLDFFPVLGGA